MNLRESIQWFAEQMEQKMVENDRVKAGWDGEDPYYFMHRASEELAELNKALIQHEDRGMGMGYTEELNTGDFTLKEEVVREAADVANFMMMVAWQFRDVFEKKPPEDR